MTAATIVALWFALASPGAAATLPPCTTGVDLDADLVDDGCDNCPAVANANQADGDGDTVGDACDVCPGDDLADLTGDGRPDNLDADLDTVADCVDACAGFDDTLDPDGDAHPTGCDNCPDVANPDQLDGDGDGIGDACPPGTGTETNGSTGTATGGTGTGTATGGTTTGTPGGTPSGTPTGTTSGTPSGTQGTGLPTGAATGSRSGVGGDGDSGAADEPKGCGCQVAPGSGGWLLAVLALASRRRRALHETCTRETPSLRGL